MQWNVRPAGVFLISRRAEVSKVSKADAINYYTCTLTILICRGCISCRWSTALTVGCNNCTGVLSEWPKSPHCEASHPWQCYSSLNWWEGLSVWSAGYSVAGDDSIALGGRRKVPEEGQLSGGSSTLPRSYIKVLWFTSGS